MVQRVAVGLSGGVDSAVAAYLLKLQGYDVFGVFMVNVEKQLAGSRCRWEDDYTAAQSVADFLKIPLYTWNFAREYRRGVLAEFFAEYRRGRTPNPDVWCNEKIKFGLFLGRALAVGADFVATGHYAGVGKGSSKNSEFRLMRGIDPAKDQSYFLHRATQFTLAHSLFPLGGYTKLETRKLATRIGLPNAERPDSQGICFVGEVKIFDFLKRHLRPRAGKILNRQGKAIGEHCGCWYYTIGQREGLGLAGGPWYVYAIEAAKNILRVTNRPQDPLLYRRNFTIENVHWISGVAPADPVRCTVEVRYHQAKPRAGVVRRSGRHWLVELRQPERAVTPGQFAVFYCGREVLGGGIIVH